MKNLIILTEKEITNIDGGTFAWDAGWFIGNSITGSFLYPAGTIDALTDYWLHYNT